KLDHADRPFDTHVFHVRKITAWRKASFQRDRDICNLKQPWFALEKIEGGIRCCTAKRIGHVSWPVHQGLLRVILPEGVEYPARRDGGGKRQRAASERFRQGDNVRRNARVLAGKHCAGAAKPGE